VTTDETTRARIEDRIRVAATAVLLASATADRVDGRKLAPLRAREAFRYAGAALAALPLHVRRALGAPGDEIDGGGTS
jgi:hypothetical protein